MASSIIRENEGLKTKPYLCTSGKLTIGYGRNLEDTGITVEEADMLLDHDIDRCISELQLNIPGFNELPYMIKVALLDMVFNLGLSRFMTFRRMLAAIQRADYIDAAKEVMDSKYARQVPTRTEKIAKTFNTVAEIKGEIE